MGRIMGSLLIGSALCMGVVSLTLSHTSRVRVHKGRSLTLPCMNTTHTGVVQYWQTPFGRVLSSLHANQKDVVAMQRDGSLRIHIASPHHSGLYYCVLLAGGQTTLTSYLLSLRTASSRQDPVLEPRRTVRSVLGDHGDERDVPVVSDGAFAAAVTASVVVTFLVGLSSGALSRPLLDRCVNWVRSLGQGRRNHGETVSVAFRKDVEQEDEDDSASTTSVTMDKVSPSPPAKPQRSFRGKRHEENTAYLEGCDQGRGEEGREGGGEEGMEVGDSTDGKERSRREGEEGRRESEEGREGEEGRTECKERRKESKGEVEEGGSRGDSSSDSEQGSVGARQGGEVRQGEGEEMCSPPQPARRSRVIRLYQYDEEGHRYGHLPNPSPMECTSPAPRAKQRSLSLTRLNTIMAAATASPLDPQSPPGRDSDPDERDTASPASPSQGQEKPVFQLEM
ncbi:uncharacterized protein LOC123485081 [Coregonus clupeaformis]|uniref:uncharacterized protein LOC123485081 n=1 Tax=Coregonus clupeaformis TaxID=59861 RepID=UPI001E1C6F8B|nr:uncharacterized protein LOC123485081 [Coregonus clupeaformis]